MYGTSDITESAAFDGTLHDIYHFMTTVLALQVSLQELSSSNRVEGALISEPLSNCMTKHKCDRMWMYLLKGLLVFNAAALASNRNWVLA